MRQFTVTFVATAVLVAAAGTAATVSSSPVRPETARKVYISALDADGAPVTNLTAADITVKENGKPYPVASVEPLSGGMLISVIIDDAGTGAFQGALATIVQKAIGKAQFRIYALNPHAMMLTDFTGDAAALKDAISKVGPRPRLASTMDQILESVSGSTKALQQRKGERGVIIAMTLSGGQPTSTGLDPKAVLSGLRSSGASLNTLFGRGADLGEALQDGAKQTGGRLEDGGTTITPAAGKLADLLTHQYVVSYALPDGVKMSDKIDVQTSRKDIKLLAPTRIPDK